MKIAEYHPSFYEGVREFKLLGDIEDELLGLLQKELTQAHANNFVLTANEAAIEIYERALNIVANPKIEPLEFRRQRILNRYQMKAPYNLPFLKDRLDAIIGKGNYQLVVDHLNYTLRLEMMAGSAPWLKEATQVVQWVKPANLRFILVPLLFSGITLKERGYVSKLVRFQLGKSRVGLNRLVEYTDEKEVSFN